MEDRRILVTGASGFIGSHVIDALLGRGAHVRALVRRTSEIGHLEAAGVELYFGDLTDDASLRAACQGVDTVVHAAAVVGSYGSWDHFYEVGVRGTERLIDAASDAGVDRFVLISSIAVYGLRDGMARLTEETPFDREPQRWNHYVREKVLSEDALWAAHAAGRIRATAIRPAVVLGRGDRNAVPRMAGLLESPLSLFPGRGDNRFPVVVVQDCAEAIVRACEREVAVGRAYNISGKEPITQAELYAMLAEAANLAPPRWRIPCGVALSLTAGLELGWRVLRRPGEPFATRIAVAVTGYDYDVDCTRAREELGWEGRRPYRRALEEAMGLVPEAPLAASA
ncbi:MAG: NAD-dependent epimerase/dehydratase family protein [bacterium]|nr:NAD-dependent epimerase/dehydratase family protein [Myxococcales bacterium]MCB9552478.1 NAD-dependent epimerase/dehydratase family protein [Myxococcales bacterium]